MTVSGHLCKSLAIHNEDPELFHRTEVLADGGVRYCTDVFKMLALGVEAVGLGWPFMYANTYGEEGVQHAIKLLKEAIFLDAVNLGIRDMDELNGDFVSILAKNSLLVACVNEV